MKKAALILIFLFVSDKIFAQQATIFKMRYLPGLIYTISQTINSVTAIDFTGDKAELSQLPVAQLPIVVQNKSNLKYTVTTGVENPKILTGIVRFLISDKTGKINGEEAGSAADSLKSKIFFGEFDHDTFKLDSLKYLRLADSLKQMISTLVNGIRIDFPITPLKPGDTFTQDVPVNMPVSGKAITVNIHTVYKLISTNNSTAFFDVSHTANLKTPTGEGDMEISGNGDGQIFYDIKYDFFRSYQNSLKLTFTVHNGKLTMKGSSNIFSVYQTNITVK